MNMRNIKLAGSLLLGILISTTVNAQSPRTGGWGNGPDNRLDRLSWLDLSEDQEEQITDLRTAYRQEMTSLTNKMGELKARERTLLSEANVDMDAVNKNIDEQTGLTNSIRKLQVKHQQEVKALLTDEQVVKMQQGRTYARGESFSRRGDLRYNGREGMNRGYRGYRGYNGYPENRGYRGNSGYRGYRGYRGI